MKTYGNPPFWTVQGACRHHFGPRRAHGVGAHDVGLVVPVHVRGLHVGQDLRGSDILGKPWEKAMKTMEVPRFGCRKPMKNVENRDEIVAFACDGAATTRFACAVHTRRQS